MISEIDKFSSGWIGMYLRLSTQEVDRLIALLLLLQKRELGHFHIQNCNNFSDETGISDIEVSLKGESELDNMAIA